MDNYRIDDNPPLTRAEAIFLLEYFKGIYKNFDYNFENKRVVFITGSSGGQITSKKDYFNDIKTWKENHNSTIATSLLLLTDEEKSEYGYDAILTKWVKVFTPKTRKKVLIKSKNITLN